MNVIDFLIQDHDKLRADALEIRNHLEDHIVRDKIKKYVHHFELHEAVEDRCFLDHLKDSPSKYELEALLKDYEQNHKKIWEALNQLVQDSWDRNLEVLKQDFFKLVSDVEWHTGEEERVYFPTFAQHISKRDLEEFGKQAQAYYDRYE